VRGYTRSRIPERPDINAFLARWFEFHRGYRLITRCDGTEERVAVIGEPLKEVSPGHLPRTLHQLRRAGISTEGLQRQVLERIEWHREVPPAEVSQAESSLAEALAAPVQSVEDTIDDLIATAEVSPAGMSTAPVQSIEDVIDDLLATAEDEAGSSDPQRASRSPLTRVEPTIASSSQGQLNPIPNEHLNDLHGEAQRERQQRIAERMTRIFGTHEEIQSEEYVSPIAGMFNRAWGRYRNLEELRHAQGNPAAINRFLDSEQESALWLRLPPFTAGITMLDSHLQQRVLQHMDLQRSTIGNGDPQTQSDRDGGIASEQRTFLDGEAQYPGLDGDGRPEPMNDEQLTVKLDCKVCLTQRASIACLPCGHLGLCQWCADQIIPVKETDKTQPRQPKRCSICRKWVKRRVQIFTP
jgi:Zinc finger, C3HC4 type (RING finger)